MRAFLLVFLFLLGCLLSTSPGCVQYQSPGTFPKHLMVNYTANNKGALFPCGCRIPLGGLSRRGGVLAAESPYPQLTVDAGSFTGSTTGYDRFTAGYILRAYAEMGYNAVNLGVRESVQPVSQIREWDSESGGILISANLNDDQGLPVTRSCLIREIGGIRIGITGITMQGNRPIDAVSMPQRILPVPPLLEVMEKFEEENVDFAVLLADTITDEIAAILSEIPGFDLVIQGQEFNPNSAPACQYFEETDTHLVRMGGSGKYLGRMRIDFNPEDGSIINNEVMRIDLDNSVPTLSTISELLTEFKIEVRERREEFLGDPTNPFQRSYSPEMTDVLVGYTGPTFCRHCHINYEFEQRKVGHEIAWTILDEGNRTNPDCLVCHTTGYGVPTGMVDPFRDSHLRGITCEACHGPGVLHVREQSILKEGLDESILIPPENPTGIPFSRDVPEEICTRCHTEEWSPDFEYVTWVERIKHNEARERRQMINRQTDEHITPDLPENSTQPSSE